MAPAKCGECGGEVSDHAESCPHCGAPFRSISWWRVAWVALGIIAIAGVLAGFVLNGWKSASILSLVVLLAVGVLTLLFRYAWQR
jgi:hypothetical protein